MLALPPELCAASLQKPDLSGPCPCCTVLLRNHEWRNPHVFKVTSLRIYYSLGFLNRGEGPVTCTTVRPRDGIVATLVGKIWSLIPRMSTTE